MLHPLLKIGPRISVLPVVNGSGDFAWEVRRVLMQGKFDCLAVPLPPSFQVEIEQAVLDLPQPSIVIQTEQAFRQHTEPSIDQWRADSDSQSNSEATGPSFRQNREERTPYEKQFESGDYSSDDPDAASEYEQDLEAEDLSDDDDDDDSSSEWEQIRSLSYVPIDPCQPVIAAIRTAMGEHIPRKFIDLETDEFEPYSFVSPDPYCLKQVRIERFAAAILPSIPRPESQQRRDRIKMMAYNLRQLSIDHQNILLVCNVLDWPWIREAYFQPDPNPPADESTEDAKTLDVDTKTLFFLLGELPFITALYENARENLDDDSRLSIDGIKRLLISSRLAYKKKTGKSARKITPLLLRQCLQYIRNLTLIERRLTPDLFTIIRATQQIAGDTYAYYVLKTARKYLVQGEEDTLDDAPAKPTGNSFANATLDELLSDPDKRQEVSDAVDRFIEQEEKAMDAIPDRHDSQTHLSQSHIDILQEAKVKVGIGRLELPSGEIYNAVSRLPGPPVTWSHLELRPKQDLNKDKDKWTKNWNPYMQCSWPPEDDRIERFRSTVFDRAKQIIGADSARSEKFTTSVQDGIDIRETLRHWYDGDIYVKVHPPVRGGMDSVVMLFDTPADPKEYKWRATWFAEHKEESTLAFYATNFADNPVGPGICTATYGGAMFLFPPRPIPEVWQDPRFNFATTLEERLIAAACKFAHHRQVALLSPVAPGFNWRRIAKQFGKTLVHVPLGQFSDSTIEQLRIVHVLNGKQVRSYAADFIRKS